MKHQATRELFGYWNGLRGIRTAPERCDIDPTAIRPILADTFMLDVAADYPVRLAGTRLAALLGAEGSGTPFLDLWAPEERESLAAVLLAVAEGAPAVIGATGAPLGRANCAFELLLLPLRHFGKTHARILGIATAATQPSWLGLAPAGPLRMASLRFVERDEPRTAGMRSADRAPAFASSRGEVRDAGAPVRTARAVPAMGHLASSRPALRLIEGGRHG